MDDGDLKKLRELIKEEVRPIKDIVELTKKKVDSHDIFLHTTADNVRTVKEQQSVMNDKLGSQAASLIEIETTIKSYADSYQENQRNIERLDTRLTTAEDEMAINVPEDLKVPHFSQ